MTKAAPSLLPPSAGCNRVSQLKAGPPRSSQSLEVWPTPSRSSVPPPAVPAPPVSAARGGRASVRASRHPALVEGLRTRISEIERHAPRLPGSPDTNMRPWRLGVPALDARFGPHGLDASGVHEVKPAMIGSVAGARAAASGFALRLASRRVESLAASGQRGAPRILWCSSAPGAHETGFLYGRGLAGLGLDPGAFLVVETAREKETLWAIEEGLRSGVLALVIGVLADVALTPARRLSLAAEEYRTPCLLLTDARSPSTGATATRWRVSPAPSSPDAFDARAPGAHRYEVSLERCRQAPPDPGAPLLLEWPDEARGFHMVADVAGRAARPAYAVCCAG